MKIFSYYLIVINMCGLIICFIDKRRALKNWYRISENTLLFISFLGGCFGFYMSMLLFHHKTKKMKFKVILPILMIIWLFLICFIFKKL